MIRRGWRVRLSKGLSRTLSISLFSILVANPLLTYAYPYVVGYHSLNNSTKATYKTDSSLLDKVAGVLGTDDDFNELLNYSTNKQINTDSAIVSYLIDNDIIGEDLNIVAKDLFNPEPYKLFDYEDGSVVVNKSDFLMTLSKAVYGVQTSRPIVYYSEEASRLIGDNRESLEMSDEYRPEGYNHLFNPDGFEDYDGNDDGKVDDIIDFSKGDYLTYVSPNVYEMYFKTLVDKSIISTEEFSNIQLVSDFTYMNNTSNGIVSTPLWSNSLGLYGVNIPNGEGVNIQTNLEPISGVRVFGQYPLGQSLLLNDKGNLTYNKIDWFFKEELLTMDALKYIEKVLRLTEKDMTELEAKIITYKYGFDYMQYLSADDVKTVQFLIAKGILNFEDPSEFDGLFKELTMDMFLKLIYRVHNPNARLDFSKVQLTDSDNFWLSNGFSESNLTLKKADVYPDTKVTVEKVSVEEISLIESGTGLFKTRPTVIASNFSDYVVTRTFYSNIKYYYKGYLISKDTKFPNDYGVGEIKESKDSKGNKVITAKFTVNAVSPEAAIAIVDANTMTDDNNVNNLGNIPTYNKVGENGNLVHYVSKDALMSADIPIKVIEDKYLMNSQTGARAVLLENNKMAIVGNEVIKTDKTMVFNINGEVHYNFEIIAKLLTDVHIDRLDPGSAYITDISKSDKVCRVTSSRVVDESVDLAYVNSFDAHAVPSGGVKTHSFVNITQSNALSNYVLIDVGKDLGFENSCYMVMEFKFIVNQSLKNVVSSFDINKFINNTASFEDVYEWMYTQPTGSDTLNSWWKENITFNDSLLNYVFGTQNSRYMKSGFLVSSISFLNNNKDDLTTVKLNDFFLNKVGLPTSLSSISYGGKSFVESFFNYNSINESADSSAITLLKKGRMLNTYVNNNLEKEGTAYQEYGDYVINKSGQVYKNINTDPDIELGVDSIKFKTKEYQDPSFRVGSIYTLVGNESADYVCSLLSGPNVVMYRKEPLKVKYKSYSNKQGYILLVGASEDNDGTEIIEYLTGLHKSITESATSISSYSAIGPKPNANLIKDDNIYYYESEFWYKENGKELRKLNKLKSADTRLLQEKDILVYPYITFNANSLTPNDDNVVDTEFNFPFLSMGNYSNFGITHQIIDSIVYDSLGYVSFGDLPQDAKITLGDLVFTKSGSSLVSGVITDTSISSEFVSVDLGTGSSTDKGIQSLAAKLFGSFNISIINKGILKGSSLLSSYITEAKIGSLTSTEVNNTLVRKNNRLYLLSKNGKYVSYENGMGFGAFVLNVKLDNSLRFRPIGSTGEYVLVTTANSNADGHLTKLPFRVETLSYSDNDLFYSNLSKSLYAKSDRAEELFTKFKDLFRNKKRQDFLGIIQYLLNWILLVLTYTVLLVAYLKRTMVDVIIKDIAYPTSDRVGVDLYSWLTLGLISVDTELSIVKSVFLSCGLFALKALINVL